MIKPTTGRVKVNTYVVGGVLLGVALTSLGIVLYGKNGRQSDY
jgi:hypothetical protein